MHKEVSMFASVHKRSLFSPASIRIPSYILLAGKQAVVNFSTCRCLTQYKTVTRHPILTVMLSEKKPSLYDSAWFPWVLTKIWLFFMNFV
jgi:hypothetical protein